MGTDDDAGLGAVAALHEPLRRELYRYVAGRPEPVGRDEAAAALEVPRSVAAFHLDKLAAAGLLEVEFRRPEGRSGPGAGRPAKLYRRSGAEFSLNVPDRRYALAARLLAEAVVAAEAEGATPAATARRVARRHGEEMARGHDGDPARRTGRSGRRRRASLDDVAGVLRDEGYEPVVSEASIILANCPFHAVAEQERDLVCGMNTALVQGVLDGMGATAWEATLNPAPGRCCVTIGRRR